MQHPKRLFILAIPLGFFFGVSLVWLASIRQSSQVVFSARSDGSGITLRWSALNEIAVTGFHVLRSVDDDDADPVSVTQQVIPVHGWPAGRRYTVYDSGVMAGQRIAYELAVLKHGGVVDLYGPVSIDAGTTMAVSKEIAPYLTTLHDTIGFEWNFDPQDLSMTRTGSAVHVAHIAWFLVLVFGLGFFGAVGVGGYYTIYPTPPLQRARRVSYLDEVALSQEGLAPTRGRGLNVSEAGILLELAEPPRVGSACTISFPASDNRVVIANGAVVRLEAANRIGIAFHEIVEGHQALLQLISDRS